MSGVPYLGSKISLISKSAIRYEGILVDVNPQESTITFEQVRFFGTEGRRPGNEIPAMDKVFDCVVFRSADIEDLQVYEEAPAAKPAQSIPDPAVVSSSEAKPASSTAATASSSTGFQYGNRQNSANDVVKMPPRDYASAASSNATNATNASAPRSYSTAASSAPQSSHQNQNTAQSRPQQPRQKIVVPDSEYDFSSANARFSKDSLDGAEATAAPAYNKHSSFFDDISCQAKEQMSGERSERIRNERDLNMETFGQAAPYRRYNNRGGRGRGRGGYYRGGYNNNNNYNNRNNQNSEL